LEFTASQLQAAEDAGQRVWIIAHMPPNRYDTLHDQVGFVFLSRKTRH
jgi:sphingomyelin phosphodiesterase